jgi:NADH-quinone oxidoreductase subunit A
MFSPVAIAAYLALFTVLGIGFLLVNLLLGYILRPKDNNAEKLEIYECGEPTIGSSFVQFDLRFYVVALLFIIFDVEVAFFFPWATVFGKATNLTDPALPKVMSQLDPNGSPDVLTPAAIGIYHELGIRNPTIPALDPAVAESLGPDATPTQKSVAAIEASARKIALFSLADIGAFFAVLMVGFAYVWRRGDLDWVRAVSKERAGQPDPAPPLAEPQPVLSA